MTTAELTAPPSGDFSDLPVTTIEPSKGWAELRLAEVWAFRELLYFLTWRDIKVRYKQSILGAAWAIIQPVVSMVVFTVIFAWLAGLDSDGHPYYVWNLAALVPWTFFANGLTTSSNSLVGSQNLIKKVYFPRLVIPSASVISGFVDFMLSFTVLLAIAGFSDYLPSARLLAVPLFMAVAFAVALGCGLWLSALNVQFRDVRFTVPFLSQIWMYATPIVWPFSKLEAFAAKTWVPFSEETLRLLWALNPMVGVVEGFRWAIGVGDETVGFPGELLAISATTAALVFVGGMFYFRRMEKTFADVV